MEKFKLDNGVRVIYNQIQGDMTSFCIGFEAGANNEITYNYGVAHALEHILFKGSKNRTEAEINISLDKIFAFNNAMTNYPYAIYYGSCSSYDFQEGFSVFRDIIVEPSFQEEGFKEEMDVILQEWKEWKEDFTQYCEDELFYNSYNQKRIKEMIIGKEESIKNITLQELKSFYDEYYVGDNCVITIISSLDIDEIKAILKNFSIKKSNYNKPNFPLESNKSGIYYKEVNGFKGAKIQYIFNINDLIYQELEVLSLYSLFIGEGMSSLLFEEVRTKNGYAYDICSAVKRERGIEVFSINTSTSKENIHKTISSINETLNKSVEELEKLSLKDIEVLKKRLILKREFWLERSVELAKYITTNEVMFNNGVESLNFKYNLNNINQVDIVNVVKKVLNNPSIEILY